MRSRLSILLAAAAALGLAACSSGGDGRSAPTATASTEPATVGVLVTDAHGTRWDQAFATITSIELLGDDHNETIFSGEETVDLLSLPDYFELFALATDVVPGDFSKIRLHVTRLELVDLDDMGVEVERVVTKLVGNGKIDINPRRTITVLGGDSLFIELDFDMEKAFKTTEIRNGTIIVRPVIFAHVVASGGSTRLTRLIGTVESVNETEQSFVLCRTGLFSNHDDDEEEEDEPEDGHCIRVATDGSTGVFNTEGMPVTVADVQAGDMLTAVGFLRHVEDEESGDDSMEEVESEEMGEAESESAEETEVEDHFVLDAVTLEIGADFERYRGIVQSEVDGDLFDFLLGPEQGFEPDTVIATQLFASTRIFSKDGEELDQLSITPDTAGIVDGVIATGGEGPEDDLLRAALIVLDPEAGVEETLLSGEIVSVLEDGTFDLLVGDTPRCVDASGADVFLVTDDEGFSTTAGGTGDLAAGMRADVYGEEGVDGCFIAGDVLAQADGS